ncbi:Protein of unknown function, partial [Gryllus bimaculatus]
MLVGNRPLGN